MERTCIKRLLAWKDSADRKPLVLLGARQVGKTHILERLGNDHFEDFISINFEENRAIHSLFDSNLDPEAVIQALCAFYNIDIQPNKTLVIFDEIQECPRALTSLKYFCEKGPQYYVAAAGSLLGLKVGKASGFPVGKVNLMHLLPMSFFEFLRALDKNQLLEYLQSIHTFEPIPEALHLQALELFKLYTFIGGMPEAVKKYRDTSSLIEVRNIHNDIIRAYEFDFAKHAEASQIAKITEIWHSIPQHLAKENKKFVFSVIKHSARAREYEAAIQWLIDAGIIYRCNNITVPKIPLPVYKDGHAFKIYVLDTGLLGSMSGLPSRAILEKNNLFTEFKGALIENIVAQQLMASGQSSLHYWTSGNTAEVDFIAAIESELIPVETKSGQSSRKKNLQVYIEKYNPETVVRASPMNLRHDGKISNYPLYLLEKFGTVAR